MIAMRFLTILTAGWKLINVISNDSSIDTDIDSFLSDTDAEELKYLLRRVNKCDKTLEKPRPIHEKTNWILMREKYDEIIDASESGLNESSNDYISGFKIEYSLNYNENGKRSIFAKESIKKGQIVYEHRSLAYFPDAVSFIDFLKHIPPDFVCDAIDWLSEWGGEEDDEAGYFAIDFDDMSYINDEGEMNIDYIDDDMSQLVAIRDINLGEELICNGPYSKETRFDNENSTAGILRELNNCEEVAKTKRPIFGKPLWILMQKIYEEITNKTMSSDDFGFRVKYSVDYSKTHGRGLFAREKIEKGQVVYQHKRDAYLSPETYPEFLNRLVLQENKRKANNQDLEPYLDFLNISPSGVICDIQMWSYDHTKTNYNLDLDDMVFCNSADQLISWENIEYSDEESIEMVATRDIDAGEEILCSYDDFV